MTEYTYGHYDIRCACSWNKLGSSSSSKTDHLTNEMRLKEVLPRQRKIEVCIEEEEGRLFMEICLHGRRRPTDEVLVDPTTTTTTNNCIEVLTIVIASEELPNAGPIPFLNTLSDCPTISELSLSLGSFDTLETVSAPFERVSLQLFGCSSSSPTSTTTIVNSSTGGTLLQQHLKELSMGTFTVLEDDDDTIMLPDHHHPHSTFLLLPTFPSLRTAEIHGLIMDIAEWNSFCHRNSSIETLTLRGRADIQQDGGRSITARSRTLPSGLTELRVDSDLNERFLEHLLLSLEQQQHQQQQEPPPDVHVTLGLCVNDDPTMSRGRLLSVLQRWNLPPQVRLCIEQNTRRSSLSSRCRLLFFHDLATALQSSSSSSSSPNLTNLCIRVREKEDAIRIQKIWTPSVICKTRLVELDIEYGGGGGVEYNYYGSGVVYRPRFKKLLVEQQDDDDGLQAQRDFCLELNRVGELPLESNVYAKLIIDKKDDLSLQVFYHLLRIRPDVNNNLVAII